MNNKIKLAITLVVIVVIIGGSKLFYDQYASKSARLVPTNTPASATGETKTTPSNTKVTEIDLDAYKAQTQQPEEFLAPNALVYDIDGNPVNFDDFRGKPTVINFWASWCDPCKIEMPYFDSVYNEMGEDVNFVMVNLTDGEQETKEKAVAFVEEGQFSFPVYYDTDRNAMITYGITSLPTTLFLSDEGFVAASVQGTIDEETLRRGISMAVDYVSLGENN